MNAAKPTQRVTTVARVAQAFDASLAELAEALEGTA